MTTLYSPASETALAPRSRPRRRQPAPVLRDAEVFGAHAHLAARFGRTGVAPFLATPDVEVIDVADGFGAGGFVRRGRWAVTPGDVVAPAPLLDTALTEYLDVLGERRLRPLFMAVADPEPYRARGLDVSELADEAVLDLTTFSLAGSKRANIRHSVTSARRAGLTIAAYAPWMDEQIAEISRQWLATKRGGELGFTLSRHEDVPAQLAAGAAELWTVLDGDGRVQAWCTWRPYLAGRARVIDIMRRRTDAPNPSMDLLIAGTLEHFRDSGLAQASLASVPREHGSLAERVYPTRSLRAYKQKFDPTWQPRWLAVPSAWRRPLALAAICNAYCPGGLRRAVLRNS